MRIDIQVDSVGPNGPQYIGYLTDLRVQGFPSPLRKSFSAQFPNRLSGLSYSPLHPSQGVANVAGMIKSVTWSGAGNDVMKLAFVVSADARPALAGLAHQSNASVQEIGWWIGAHDRLQGYWYQAFCPKLPVKPQARVSNCIVSPQATKVGSDSAYSVYLELCAPSDSVSLCYCPTAGTSTVMSWGSFVHSKTPPGNSVGTPVVTRI